MPYYRAIARNADGIEGEIIATADNYLDLAAFAATAIEQLGLEEAELQMSVDGEVWATVEDEFTLDSPDLDL